MTNGLLVAILFFALIGIVAVVILAMIASWAYKIIRANKPTK